MENKFENLAREVLGNAKVSEKVPELKTLAESDDVQRLKEKFASADLLKAVEKGDSRTLQSLLSSVLQTEEGARLAKKLSDMFK